MLIEIKNRYNGNVLFSHDCEENTLKITLDIALKAQANLRYADLTGVDLTGIRDDMFAVLSAMPSEVIYLIESLKNGKVDGSTYQGACACLVGTLANARGVEYRSIDGLTPNSSRPIERFFMNIKEGDTPETNQCSKFALEWAESWLARMQAAFSPLVIK